MNLVPSIILVLSVGVSVSLPSLVLADRVYRWVDEEGIVYFSDQPIKGGEQVEIPEIQSYTAFTPTLPPPSVTPEQQEEWHGYDRVQILKPEKESTVRNAKGLVSIEIDILPPLQPEDQIRFLLDGQPVKGLSKATAIFLEDVPRGEHQVQVAIVDKNGDTILTSEPVVFYMQRPIALSSVPKPLPQK